MTGWYSSSWKARSLEYGEGGGFPPPFSYATKQSGGDKTHRPPDTAARLRPTRQPVCFTTERAVCDTLTRLDEKKSENIQHGSSAELTQVGYINDYNGDANRVYDGAAIARALKAEAGGGGAKTGWYKV